MDDVQGDRDGDPEEQTEDEIVIIPVKDNRSFYFFLSIITL